MQAFLTTCREFDMEKTVDKDGYSFKNPGCNWMNCHVDSFGDSDTLDVAIKSSATVSRLVGKQLPSLWKTMV